MKRKSFLFNEKISKNEMKNLHAQKYIYANKRIICLRKK